MHKDTLFFSNQLISWYLSYHRDLPWRANISPYRVWLSEIILQQTKVEQGLPYYKAFVSAYPSVEDLANASEDEVLLMWQGLGYYSRARNLHASAKYIVEELNGVFPDNYKALLSLKGVGDYTASAISSICFNEAQAVVDGNVYRFLSRFFGIHTPIPSSKAHREFKELGNLLMDSKQAGTFNQAMMEFGALQCVPRNPSCQSCVFSSKCVALQNNMVHDLPVKKKKAKVKKRYFNYLVVDSGDGLLPIQQRLEKDIWYKLYQLPLVESTSALSKPMLMESLKENSIFSELDVNSLSLLNNKQVVHKLSHQHLYTRFWAIEGNIPNFNPVQVHNLEDYAFPTLLEEFLKAYFVKEFFLIE